MPHRDAGHHRDWRGHKAGSQTTGMGAWHANIKTIFTLEKEAANPIKDAAPNAQPTAQHQLSLMDMPYGHRYKDGCTEVLAFVGKADYASSSCSRPAQRLAQTAFDGPLSALYCSALMAKPASFSLS